MKMKLFTGVAFAAILVPGVAFAQSTGSTDFDAGTDIVVTGTKANKGGITVPDVPKTRTVVGADLISRQRPGQTVNEIINLVPGVSFQNNDATGAAGGTFTIRGFDSSRISQTLDGVPLNDTGNYAIYSNQQQDPETLESISVNLGSTDVDSPTASAVGGTVNIRTRKPTQEFSAMMSGTYGTYLGQGDPLNRSIYRVYGSVDTGEILHTGVRAFFTGSSISADNPFSNYSRLKKQQYNARIYKDLGDNGDFLSLAGQWNENRNNFLGSVPLRNDTTQVVTINNVPTTVARIVGPNSNNRAPLTAGERFYSINYPCTVGGATPAQPSAGAACGTEFDRRFNPSNTGNVRFGSRFTLTPKLVLTVDASYQYTKANGGGTVSLLEGCGNLGSTTNRSCATTNNVLGVINTTGNTGNGAPGGFAYLLGRDLNGDGIIGDGANGRPLTSVTAIAPSQTQTRRYVGIVGLAYEFDENNRVRINYTGDYGRHRQTGEAGFLNTDGTPLDVFPVNSGIVDGKGALIEKRNRKSLAILNQVSAEYRGKFFDNKLTVVLGVVGKFFKRDLTQYCFTVAANTNVACVSPSQTAAYAAANPYTYFAPGVSSVNGVNRPLVAGSSCAQLTSACVVGFAPPQQRVSNYNRVLPNVGATYNFTDAVSMYVNFAQNVSVPSTDNLYSSFYYAEGSPQSKPKPESTDSYELGLRYTTGKVQAQVAGWYTKFKNRTVTVYDVESDTSVSRNLGTVDKYGFDGSVSYSPVRNLTAYVFGSYLHSKINDNIEAGRNGSTVTYFQTAGKREGGSPTWMAGGRLQGTVGIVDLGAQAKYTGSRFVNDENLPIYTCSLTSAQLTAIGGICPTNNSTQIYGARIPSYTIVDLDVRINVGQLLGNNRKTFFQVNVSNLFDKVYIGGLSGSSGFVGLPNRYSIGNAVIGTPRSITGSLVVAL